MIDAPIALAFTAGMIASINPCGFALLPAYIGAFVAGDDTQARADQRIARAVGVSAAVSVGFAAMFVIVGVLFTQSVGSTRIALVVVGLTAIAYLAVRLRNRHVDTL